MFPPGHQNQDPDAPIRATDNDAAVARLSAVQKHYLHDPFVRYLVPRAHLQPPRPPLINIGTYVRTAAIDLLVDEFIDLAKQSGQKCQITGPRKDDFSTYIEVDFPEIVTRKAMAIRKSKELNGGLGDPAQVKVVGGGTGLHSAQYHLLSADLRRPPTETLEPLFTSTEHGVDGQPLLSPSLPTFLLFECVLAYMEPGASSTLLEWFAAYVSKGGGILGCLIYEMFKLNDAFGRVMLANLQARNVTLPGAEPFTTLESLSKRFTDTGFTAARALTLREIRRAYIDETELERIAKLEFLDETEELDLVLDHYAISWGLLISSEDKSTWGSWGLKQKRA
ncbi:leucine carboxyl methyltransferase [Coprinopsis cinerea okayama7|uniref:Leucine carboxyl methyltransferase 1 n=1 Tax=Coprinopsis cinerea (strain Okayama-7 / 130 / ATCC MYA-4618 / FGSC 9003) TaxID=240176 RepID=D6RLP4_COPC7|nr:leucine carboxyl methyltransferase [Coprinopsis cinerea okayama7\|eukprot:XP_002911706.1 leucine carboxyl methyltransferase [Coprinopsis cinerea okayama7\